MGRKLVTISDSLIDYFYESAPNWVAEGLTLSPHKTLHPDAIRLLFITAGEH